MEQTTGASGRLGLGNQAIWRLGNWGGSTESLGARAVTEAGSRLLATGQSGNLAIGEEEPRAGIGTWQEAAGSWQLGSVE